MSYQRREFDSKRENRPKLPDSEVNVKKVRPILDKVGMILNPEKSKEEIEEFISLAEDFGKYCAGKEGKYTYKTSTMRKPKTREIAISSSQIRGIFDKVKRINTYEGNEKEIQLLRPKLAYQKGRHEELTDFQKVFDELIKNIDSEEKLQNFKDFFEAVIAYHKAYGGGD